MMEFFDLKGQLSSIRPAIDARIKKVLDHGQFIMGPEVDELEEKLAAYVGVKHCISCANGTDALQISLMSLGIKRGDIVFTSAFSFVATAEVIPLVGATPFFADIDPNTYNLCPASLECAIKQSIAEGLGIPKAVIAVDMFGLPANYPALQVVCDKYDLFLIADGAQSFGASIGNKRCGSFGNISTTSFFPSKPLGCYGDGGAIFTQSDELAEICRSIRAHGKGSHKYENIRIGLNSRLDTMQAAVLLEKLVHFPKELKSRHAIAEYYSNKLATKFYIPEIPMNYISSWAQYSLRDKKGQRTHYQQALNKENLPSAIYYPKGLNKQPAMACSFSLPTLITDQYCEHVFSLPMHAYLSFSDTDRFIAVLTR